VRSGLLGTEPGAGAAEVRVGPVSRRTDGTQYAPPPGVVEELQDRRAVRRVRPGVKTKSLKLEYDASQPGERAEVFFRYPQQPRSLLAYRELRLWVVPRAGAWGSGAGANASPCASARTTRNYYLYQTPLRPATGPGPVQPADWMPELVIPFEPWLALKLEAERLLLERGRAPGADTLWSADSTYALVLEDRARAPNLAAVREIAFAVYNGAPGAASGEVWINELRTGAPDRGPGAAGNIGLDIVAGDVAGASITLANRGAGFRQLGETPRYDRLLPASWALDLPVTVTHARSGQAPAFLEQSDVRADRLDNLRTAGTSATRVAVRISRTEPLANPLLGLLVDGSALRLAYRTGTDRSVVSRTEAGGFTGDFTYRREPAIRDVPSVPRFLGDALGAVLPAPLEQSDAFRRLVDSRLRWSPATLSFGTTYSDLASRSWLYDRILALPGDTAVTPIESPRRSLRSDVRFGLRPFDRLTASLDLISDRDLLDPDRAATRALERDALRRARADVAGVGIGWEAARVLNGTLSYRPDITDWLSAGYSYGSRFATDRSASWLELDIAGADTSAVLQRRFEATRQVSRTVQLRPGILATSLGGDTASILRFWQRIDLEWRGTLASRFDRETAAPGIGYQLGLGDFDAFRVIGADTAARAQQRASFAAGTAFGLPGAGTLNINYTAEDVDDFEPRGGSRSQRRVGWPAVNLMWSRVAVPAFLDDVVRNWGGSIGLQRNETTTEYDAAAGQTRGVTELRVPVSLNVAFGAGLSVSYRAAFSSGEHLDPTGNVESGGRQQDLGVTGVFQPPESWRERLSGPITTRLSYAEQQQSQCRYNATLAQLDGCIAFLDLGTRSANFTIESILSDITVGALLSYTARQNQVGTRTGSTQFQFGLYGRFNFTAGVMPDGL
jgi:hypothetical protein